MHIIKGDIEYSENFWNGHVFLYYKGEDCIKSEEGYYEYKPNTPEYKKIEVIGNTFKGVKAIVDSEEITLINPIGPTDTILSILYVIFILYPLIFENDIEYCSIICAVCAGIFGVVRLLISRNFKSILAKIIVTILVGALCFGVIALVIWILSLKK